MCALSPKPYKKCVLSRLPNSLVEPLLSSLECQKLSFLSKELYMDEKQLRVDSYTGMCLALQKGYGPWCGFRGPEKTFTFHSPSFSKYWFLTQIYSFSTELLICHLNETWKGDILSHIRDLYTVIPNIH